MRLLLTGAWGEARQHVPELEAMGHEIAFLPQEKDLLPVDPAWPEGVICNGLFLYHPIAAFTALRFIQLTAAGIGVVHAGEIHDYPVWNKSYTRSAETVRAVTEQYPGVCISLDIHRDAIASGTTVTAPVCEIGGRQSAQIMIISGCDDGTMNLPNYRANFHFASILQQTAETMYSGFTRPIMFDYRKYNQDLTGERGASLLIEVGSQGNTRDEATYAGELLGKALAETIRQLAAKQEGD